jgi:hypothetical protein
MAMRHLYRQGARAFLTAKKSLLNITKCEQMFISNGVDLFFEEVLRMNSAYTAARLLMFIFVRMR